MSTIAIVYRKDKLNKSNEAPINFRIIKNRKITYISTGIKIKEDLWDFSKNAVKPKHPNSKRFNSYLYNKFTELQNEVYEHETNTKSLTGNQLRDRIYGKKPTDFFEFAENALQVYLDNGKIGTYDKNKSIIKKLKKYVRNRNLSFQDITIDFLNTYEKYLRKVLKNKTNTVLKDFKFMRKLFNDAYKDDIIEHHLNPFNKYKMKSEKTERCFLTEEELSMIENFKATPGTRLEQHRDLFIFASYTGGLRISDLLQLQLKHFDGSHIHFKIMKTSSHLSIKVPDKAIDIINKYYRKDVSKNLFLFPILPDNLDLNNPRELDTAISRATAYINKNLKIIARKLNIEKNISFHISRHTFATRALRKGITIDKVSKLLGHAAIRETQVYAKIVNSELDKAMDVFND